MLWEVNHNIDRNRIEKKQTIINSNAFLNNLYILRINNFLRMNTILKVQDI